ncbi:thiol peroxidase [Lactobacillus sp. ESL0791]|uniref:thiol peroxidase n=1 Tax=Lactobacillus sp. ESL0791 TaxID=2983234 RepID=UPI0023F859BE|nr:thiol peroxidase [Lactobacillus sp. ESL0791]MDF7638976.1 thiol peroxidase [Lactobacillus sp. ESL0791]
MKITRLDAPMETNGQPPKVGEKLPAFTVTKADGSKVTSTDLITRPTLISVVPNINTSVCSISTKHFNTEIDNYDGINFYTISTNTPAEQKDWCAAEGVKKMELVSDQDYDFGKKMGLFIADGNLDSRSVWIVDANGKVLYQELVYEMTHEPDYDAALKFLKKL